MSKAKNLVNLLQEGATAYDVYLNDKLIDTVWQDDPSDEEEVRKSLIDHDGYDPSIEVEKAQKSEGKGKKGKKESMMCPECNVAMKAKKFDDPSTGNKYERFQCPKCKNQAPTSKQSWKMKEQQGSQYTIMIDTENEAFGDDPAVEIARILQDLVKDLESKGVQDKKLRDANGNTVGKAAYE
jgi:DNA-directed RNA polymerase subunit M/transcription elongation factor TFIIS